MFSIGIEFLTGSAVMTATASREEAEWPPHPARVFMALVAAHYETRPLPTDGADALASWTKERQALEWLEQQGSPALSCPTDVAQHRRSVVKQYVPVNDATMPRNPATVKPADLRDALGIMPALRSRQERTFPSVSIGLDAPDRFVHLIWSEVELPSELSVPFAQLLAKVIRVGHSSSLVQVWLNDATSVQPEPTLIPQLAKSRSASAANLRTIGTGLLADLDQRFNAEEIDLFFDLAADIESTSGKAKDAAKKAFKEQFGEDWRASLAAPVRLRPVVHRSKVKRRRRPCPAGILPFGFTGQTIRLSILRTQPLAERDRVIPTDIHHWMVVRLGKATLLPGVLRLLLVLSFGVQSGPTLAVFLGIGLVVLGLHECRKLPLRDLMHPHVKRFGDPHPVLWPFGLTPVLLIGR